MKNKKKNKVPITSEPPVGYGKDIVFFKSFEEMNNYDYREMAQLSPEQCLQHITEYLQLVYAEELKNKMDLTIHFK